MTAQIWVLGGTGRSGRTIAAQLARLGLTAVLVGRDANRLHAAAQQTGSETLLAPSLAAAAAEIRQQCPAVVINTVGPFTTTAPEVIDACRAVGSHYIDLANDVEALSAAYEMHHAATQAGHTLVTGAGFGVTATESVVMKLCEGASARSLLGAHRRDLAGWRDPRGLAAPGRRPGVHRSSGRRDRPATAGR
ncbi:saccharopine dehydrogenase NADP-binding domain-containing protein [Streptomyces sp. S465]|uniref:saccharopine dehydrogenase NADP-binding domain-containing protein n=1 Tax=Streptomyces sp. S465 TaxID=2979468 RepID=UPI0022A830E0|nr:saccharopine dehydrogenase NADP-binding domain-containing protein [Streptomyces sp. S465]WAP53530.1 saccharopine dehydrogenase NADP-binding domain-containing protein [Streptomyces sp. S465]